MHAQYFHRMYKHVLLVAKRKGMAFMDVSGDDYRVRIILPITTSKLRSQPMSLVSQSQTGKPKA